MPSKNLLNVNPFYKLIIKNTGDVSEIIFYEGTTEKTKECVGNYIENLTFSKFVDGPILTLYVVDFPGCRVSERDTLHR